MLEYTIQKTKTKGDYIIRAMGGREYARFDTEAEAHAWVVARMAADAQESAERQQRAQQQASYDNSLPALYQMQLEWQRWRTWFYGELRHESKRIAAARRALDYAPHPESPTYAGHELHLTEDMDDQERARALYDEIVVPLDTRIKTARKAKDTESLKAALLETIPVIAEMGEFFPHVARPEKQKGGTAPDTSINLGDERKQWLRDQGGIQPTIQRLLDAAMQS